MKLHLLDATYELFRAHFGYPPRNDTNGEPIHAVAGLIESTLGLLRQEDVTHVGAAFDSVILSFRNDLFDGYKTGEGIEPELMVQFPIAERALEALGVKVCRYAIRAAGAAELVDPRDQEERKKTYVLIERDVWALLAGFGMSSISRPLRAMRTRERSRLSAPRT